MAKKAYVGVPETYEVLEYIQSTGPQYIDTKYAPQSDNVVYETAWMETTLNTAKSLFGCQGASGATNRFSGTHYKPSTTEMYSATGATDGLCRMSGIAANTVNTLTTTINNGAITRVQNGVTSTASYSGTIQTSYNIYLLANNVMDTASQIMSDTRLYYWRMTDDGVLVRDMLPVRRASDDTVGMYDTANGVFYGNAGTGVFVAGAATGEVITAPSVARKIKKGYVGVSESYEVLEYIESTGTQYIDTGFVPNQDTRVYTECVFPTASSTQGLFGARTSSSANQFQFVTSGNYYRSDYNTEASNVTNASYGTEKFYVDKAKNVFDLNGDHSLTQTYAVFTCPGSIYIFATNNNGSVYAQATAKVYVFRVYDNGVLVRDMIPAERLSDGAVGMYDRANGVFYGNAGTGAFVAGAATGEVITAPSVARKVKKAYVGIGGIARPFWAGGKPTYYGSIPFTPYVTGMYSDAEMACTIDDTYALFAGGNNGGYAYSDKVHAYNKKLTAVTAPNLSVGRAGLSAGAIGSYGLFAGGIEYTAGRVNTVEAYSLSLTKTTAATLQDKLRWVSGASGKNHAIFAGGQTEYYIRGYVSAFDRSLTKTNPSALSTARVKSISATIGEYTIFAGGDTTWGLGTNSAAVDCYNGSLTKMSISSLGTAMRHPASASISDTWALFGGGIGGGGKMYAYDSSLTMISNVTELTGYTSVNAYTGGNLEGYGLFFPYKYDQTRKDIEIYDESLTKTLDTTTTFTIDNGKASATTLGEFCLVFQLYYTNTVGVYTLV